MKIIRLTIRENNKIDTTIKHLEAKIKELKAYKEKGFNVITINDISINRKNQTNINLLIKRKKEITNE